MRRTSPTWTLEGSVVFVDISGFTKLSETLARKGKEGAEQVTEAIERVLHRAAGRGLRERWRPAQVRRRRAAAVLRGAGSRRYGRPRLRWACAAPCAPSAGSTCRAPRSSCACRSGAHSGIVRLLPGGGFAPRVDRDRPGLDAHGRDGTRSDRGPDPREPGDGGAVARRMPRPDRRAGGRCCSGNHPVWRSSVRTRLARTWRRPRSQDASRRRAARARRRGRGRPRAPSGGHGVPPVRRDR